MSGPGIVVGNYIRYVSNEMNPELELAKAYIKATFEKSKSVPSVEDIAKELGLTTSQVKNRLGSLLYLTYISDPKIHKHYCKQSKLSLKEENPAATEMAEFLKQFPAIELTVPIFSSRQNIHFFCHTCQTESVKPMHSLYKKRATQKTLCQNCPGTKKFKGEESIRLYFETAFNLPFPKTKPSFLKNPETGNLLELDGYNKELGIAFEYRGSVHYSQNFFHKTKESLEKLEHRNGIKEELCQKAGIKLIVVPNLNCFFEKMAFNPWITKELISKGITPPAQLPELEYTRGPYLSIKRDLLAEVVKEEFKKAQSLGLTPDEFYQNLIQKISN